MGGHIWADSQPGKGSRFHVAVPLKPSSLPFDVPPQGPSNGESEAGLQLPGISPVVAPRIRGEMRLRVLVAEDNKVNQLLIKRILKHYGHEVGCGFTVITIFFILVLSVC